MIGLPLLYNGLPWWINLGRFTALDPSITSLGAEGGWCTVHDVVQVRDQSSSFALTIRHQAGLLSTTGTPFFVVSPNAWLQLQSGTKERYH